MGDEEQQIISHHQKSREKLDDRIARRDWILAVAAAAVEKQPAENRNIILPRQLVVAIRTMRRRMREGFSARQPPDNHIEKRADARPKGEEKGDEDNMMKGRHWIGDGRQCR